jgi:uncharacterized membrane protein
MEPVRELQRLFFGIALAGLGTLASADLPVYAPIWIGGYLTSPAGINDAGQIVGTLRESFDGPQHGFLYVAGRYTNIDVPGATGTYPFGINDAGQIVGQFVDDTGVHGFLYRVDRGFSTIDVPGAQQTYASGINDSGEIVGAFQKDGWHGFLADSEGSFRIVDAPGSVEDTRLDDIDDAGQIIGSFVQFEGNTGTQRSFLLGVDGEFNIIDVPDASFTVAGGINVAGQVIGHYQPRPSEPPHLYHGFLLDADGRFTTFDVLGSLFVLGLAGINDAGQVVGSADIGAFLIPDLGSPVPAIPEQSSLAMFGSALLALAFAWRRRIGGCNVLSVSGRSCVDPAR